MDQQQVEMITTLEDEHMQLLNKVFKNELTQQITGFEMPDVDTINYWEHTD
jgi:hypothetical protein